MEICGGEGDVRCAPELLLLGLLLFRGCPNAVNPCLILAATEQPLASAQIPQGEGGVALSPGIEPTTYPGRMLLLPLAPGGRGTAQSHPSTVGTSGFPASGS